MGTKSEELKARATRFALSVMNLVDRLPRDPTTRHLTGPLVRSANSVAANYRATCRARSLAEFVAKIGTVAEEADESLHWLQVLSARGWMREASALIKEADELVAIFSRSQATAKRRLRGGS